MNGVTGIAATEAERFRAALGTDAENRARADTGGELGGAASLVVKVITAPGQGSVFTTVQAVVCLGTEVAGGAAIYTPVGSNFQALNLGTGKPAAGTMVEVTYCPHRWVYRYD